MTSMTPTSSPTDGITRVDLADLLALRARAGKPVMHAARVRVPLAGGHVSAVRGRGMDYAESRVYQAGDDVRNIDWRRTARSGKWHTKLFEAERERGVLLLIDTHASMRFGTRTRFKSVAAARAAAWLAWTCVRGGDRIGALAFGSVRAAVDLHAGTRGALATLGAIAQWDALAQGKQGAAGDEPLSVALTRARRLAAPGSRVWLLSDGWCTDAAATAALARLSRSTEVRVAIVADAIERELAPAGVYPFETGKQLRRVDLSNPVARARFRATMAHGWRGLAEACDAAHIAWVTLASSDEPAQALAPLLRAKVRRP